MPKPQHWHKHDWYMLFISSKLYKNYYNKNSSIFTVILQPTVCKN